MKSSLGWGERQQTQHGHYSHTRKKVFCHCLVISSSSPTGEATRFYVCEGLTNRSASFMGFLDDSKNMEFDRMITVTIDFLFLQKCLFLTTVLRALA